MFNWKKKPNAPKIIKRFTPKEDITAYEIAILSAKMSPYIAAYNGVLFEDDQWDILPDNLKRHFVDK